MPQGYYTMEQWRRPKWVTVRVLPCGLSLTAAEQAVSKLPRPALYRLTHTQRILWSDPTGRIRKSHASSPQSLADIQSTFDRTRGVYPTAEAQAARRAQKAPRRQP